MHDQQRKKKVLRSMFQAVKAASLYRSLPRIAMLLLLTAAPLGAQTLTPLYSFTGGSDGGDPYAGLTLSGNTLYGTTVSGGSSSNGIVFSVNTNGTGFTVLHTFTGGSSDGGDPGAGMTLSGNILYGTTVQGGSSNAGVLFSVNTDGTGFTVLHTFTRGSDGGSPSAGLTLAGNTLYGMALNGGSSHAGVLFSVNTSGTGFTVLHTFTGGSDGLYPSAGLTLSGSTLYGTTVSGGSSHAGVLFSVNTDGTGFTVLHSFTGGSDGGNPGAGLTLSGNILYGTTDQGGSSNAGVLFSVNTDGTGFTTLYSFTGGSDGRSPNAGMTLAGNILYGTTYEGGSSGYGVLFSINTNGTGFTTLYSFTGGSDGGSPYAGLTLSDNTLYGTAINGGSSSNGVVFSFTLSTTNSGTTNTGTIADTNTGTNLAGDPNFISELVSNPDFLSSLSYVIKNTPGGYGMLQQGPQGIQGPVGARGATGPQGVQGPTGVFDPTVLTNTDFLNGLAANTNFVSALATNPIFLTALASQLTSGATNYGIASKATQTITFPAIPALRFAITKKLTLNATSSAKIIPITYTIANPAVALISNNILLLQGTGTTTVTASQAGNSYFNPATNTQTLIVK